MFIQSFILETRTRIKSSSLFEKCFRELRYYNDRCLVVLHSFKHLQDVHKAFHSGNQAEPATFSRQDKD